MRILDFGSWSFYDTNNGIKFYFKEGIVSGSALLLTLKKTKAAHRKLGHVLLHVSEVTA